MRIVRYAFLAILAICLVTVALANRQDVTLNLLPSELANLTGLPFSVTLPLFVVVFLGVIAGVLVGFVWEWLREHKHRSEAVRARSEAKRLEREVRKAKGAENGDDVLALLDGSK